MAERQETPTVRHETSDVNIRAVFTFGAALVAVALLIHFFVWLLFGYFSSREAVRARPEYPLRVGQAERQPPEPRLQTNPREDLRSLRDAEDAILGSYGWVDKNAGVVRIPIERAMQLTVEQGLPARSENEHKR